MTYKEGWILSCGTLEIYDILNSSVFDNDNASHNVKVGLADQKV